MDSALVGLEVGMTYIDQASAKRGDIVRHIHTYGATGSIVDTTRQLVVGSHWLDLQELDDDDEIISDQLQFNITHEIYPHIELNAPIYSGDVYQINNRSFVVVEIENLDNVWRLRVSEILPTGEEATAEIAITYSRFIYGLPPFKIFNLW